MHTIEQTWQANDVANGLEYSEALTGQLVRVKAEIDTVLWTMNASGTDRHNVKLCLEEAGLNAIIHGNLGVSSEWKDDSEDAFKEAQRAVTGEPLQRVVTVRSEIKRLIEGQFIVQFTIEDQGNGFDPEALPDPLDPENLIKPYGRGILLMKEYMKAQFSNNGRRVSMDTVCVPLEKVPLDKKFLTGVSSLALRTFGSTRLPTFLQSVSRPSQR